MLFYRIDKILLKLIWVLLMISRTRHFFFLCATTAVLSLTAYGNAAGQDYPSMEPPEADIPTTDTGVNTDDTGTMRAIEAQTEAMRTGDAWLLNWMRLDAEQRDNFTAAAAAQATDTGTAINQEARAGVRQGVQAGAAMQISGLEPCPVLSGVRSLAVTETGAQRAADELLASAMDVINGSEGTIAENGKFDYARQMFEKISPLCDPRSQGGDAQHCVGAGTEHATLGTLLNKRAISPTDPEAEKLEVLQQLLFAEVPVSVQPDLLENPTTDVQDILIEAERLKADMSVGQSLFSKIYGNRMKIPGTSASGNLRERLEINGWAEEDIAKLVDGGLSKNAMYFALTAGSLGTPFLEQEIVKNETGLLSGILYELKLGNTLANHNREMLEAIALTTAITASKNRDDAIEDLNRRISALNSGN